MDVATKLSVSALIVSVVTGIFGAFGGIPGIKALFFNKPKIAVEGFVPVIVYEKGNTEATMYPKFDLNGIVKVTNSNSFDINLREIKLYGRTQDTYGKYKYKGKPILYELNVVGTFAAGHDIVKAFSSSYLKCHFVRFENDQNPDMIQDKLRTRVEHTEDDSLLFCLNVPGFVQMFKYNNNRIPHELVSETRNGKLTFSLVFNNELIAIKPTKITNLVSSSQDEWADNDYVVKLYNATKYIYK